MNTHRGVLKIVAIAIPTLFALSNAVTTYKTQDYHE
jgi:hypothetical protein